MPGRKKLPTAIHVLRGTTRKDRANPDEPKPKSCIPEPPDFLSGEAVQEWNRLTEQLDKLGLISELDRTELAMYCQSYARMVKYEKLVAEKGELYKTPSGAVQLSPAMWIINRAQEQCHKYLTEFGMTPASRAKVSSNKPADKTTDNGFSTYGAKAK